LTALPQGVAEQAAQALLWVMLGQEIGWKQPASAAQAQAKVAGDRRGTWAGLHGVERGGWRGARLRDLLDA
jgi:hypothetical protein